MSSARILLSAQTGSQAVNEIIRGITDTSKRRRGAERPGEAPSSATSIRRQNCPVKQRLLQREWRWKTHGKHQERSSSSSNIFIQKQTPNFTISQCSFLLLFSQIKLREWEFCWGQMISLISFFKVYLFWSFSLICS